MPSSINPTSSLTMWDAVSSHKTLGVMTVAACIFVPIILIYTSWSITKCGVSLPINTLKKIHIVCTNQEEKYMWYFAWILGILMACFAGVLSALYIEHHQNLDEE
jgi:cytochrome d ubiquinol oxidase subunit II